MLCMLPATVGCNKNKGNSGDYPDNFNSLSDSERVDYVMKKVPGDSLARFIIYSALGKNQDVKIDTLAIATNYAYEHLQGEQLDNFSREYDAVIESLPLAEKMRAYKLGASEDPQGLGYQLGLEYIGTIRDDHLKVADVEKELKTFRKACDTDTATYRRFMVGFKTALRIDRGKGVPEEIYQRFINY